MQLLGWPSATASSVALWHAQASTPCSFAVSIWPCEPMRQRLRRNRRRVRSCDSGQVAWRGFRPCYCRSRRVRRQGRTEGSIPVTGDIGELLVEAGLGRGAALADCHGSRPRWHKAAGNPAQALGRDLRAAAAVDFAQLVPTMRPTIRKLYRRSALAARQRQPVVAGIVRPLAGCRRSP